MSEQKIPIPAMLYNAAVDGHVTNSQQIIDENENKEQSQINAEVKETLGKGGSVDTRINQAKNDIIGGASSNGNTLKKIEDRVSPLESAVGSGGSVDSRISAAVDTETTRAQTAEANRYTKSETYTKEEVHNLITTPNQEYVSVTATSQTTAVTDVLPATGAADTTYRVGNWDGTQYNDSVFSEYAWNGSTYIKLSTKSQIGEVYDISANHADTKYADLAAALGTNGANIPQSLQKGGMSVKFVQSSDNKYVQYRLMADTFTIDTTQWQGVDDEPTAGSDNLVKSGGVLDKVIAQTVLYKKAINAVKAANPTQTVDIKSGSQVKVKFTGISTDIPSSTYIQFGFNDAGGHTIGGAHNIYATDNWESDFIILTDDGVLAWLIFYGNDWTGQPTEWEILDREFINEIVPQIIEGKIDKTSIIQTVDETINRIPSSSAVYNKVTAQNVGRAYTKSVSAIKMTNPTQTVDIPQGTVVKFKFNNVPTLSTSNRIQFGLNDANSQSLIVRNVTSEDNWESDFINVEGNVVLAWLIFYGDDWDGEAIEWCIDELNTFFISDTPFIGNIGMQKYKPNFNIPISEVGYGVDYTSGEVVNSGYSTVVLGPVDIDDNFKFVDIKNRISAAGAGVVFYTENGTKLKPIGSANYSDATNELLEVPYGAVSFRCTAIPNKEHEINFYTKKYEKGKYKLEEIFGSEIGGKSGAFGNAKIATNYNNGEGTSLSPYVSGDNAGGINTAIGESSDRGGKVIVPVGEYLISSPVIITHDCINIEGEIWNYPAHPNGVYESNNGSKLKLASNNIPAITLSRIWNGWRIAQIGVAGTVSNGGTKGLFDKSNPGVNCGLLINQYTDQFEVNRVSFEGLAAGIVGVNCTWDAGIMSRVNADGCNIGIYLETASSYYFKIKDCILSDCPAFGMYIKSTSSFGGLEICGNVMVRNGGGLTTQQITDFGGDEEVASCIIKNLSRSTFHHNYIHSPGTWMNPTSGTPTAETQERYGIIFSATDSTFEGNNISGGKGNVIRGNCVNVISNVMPSKLILDGENHLVTGNVVSEIVVNADGCTIMNNRCTLSKITINGDNNYIVCPQGYTIVDNGSNNNIVRL